MSLKNWANLNGKKRSRCKFGQLKWEKVITKGVLKVKHSHKDISER